MYSEYVFVDLSIQPTIRMHHIFICGLSGSIVFIHIISHTRHYFKKTKVTEYKICFDFLNKFFLKHFAF